MQGFYGYITTFMVLYQNMHDWNPVLLPYLLIEGRDECYKRDEDDTAVPPRNTGCVAVIV